MKQNTPNSSPTLPELTFPTVNYGRREIPLDLRIFLYKGASSEKYDRVFNKISNGGFGKILQERIELIQYVHRRLNEELVSGKSERTTRTVFYAFRLFIGWVDNQAIELSIRTVETAFQQWSDYLLNRVLKTEITMRSAYSISSSVSKALSEALEKTKSLMLSTRLQFDKRCNAIALDDQNLSDIFKFGHLLIDVVNCLNIEAIYGTLPIKIELRSGIFWDEWSGLSDANKLKAFSLENRSIEYRNRISEKRSARESEHSVRTRSSPINLRLYAELLIFIAQTGMNLTQTRQLKMAQANYTSSIDGYLVRAYKNRKGGETQFEIFSQYRDHFEKYLSWRKKIFEDTSELLFPFCFKDGSPTPAATVLSFKKIRDICKTANVKFFGPKELRKTRINWLYRQTRNTAFTAEQAQNTIEVLHRNYFRASLQIAKVEVIQYWSKNDPTLQQNLPAAALGICDGVPKPIVKMPLEAPKPDCMHPSGCLFCEHHRDIDSEDYVWSITSMKFFNSILIGKYPPKEKNRLDTGGHIELALEMLVQKLKWLESSNTKRKKWVDESLARCNEGDYHPHWSYLIASIEN